MEWLNTNWEWLLLGSYLLDKIAKATPTPYDDFVIDVVWGGLKKLVRK